MRAFKTKSFVRFARREKITDDRLAAAIARAERGSVDAELGGGLIEQRLAREGQGRSGGYRTIIAYRAGARAVVLFGFAKIERENVSPDELDDLRLLARDWLRATASQIAAALADGAIEEVAYDKNDET